MKKLFITIFSVACCTMFLNAAHAVDNTSCSVTSSDDSPTVGTLRRDLDQGYNRTTNRSCTEFIKFGAGSFTIQPGSTFVVGAVDASGNALNNDGEFIDATHASDGANLTITKDVATSVTIDATAEAFNADNCVVDIKNPNVKILDITIKSKTRAKALCGSSLNAASRVTIIANDDVCTVGSTCCDSNGQYQSAGSACTDGQNHSGTCSGSNTTCTPTPVTQCTPDTTCCDHAGNYAGANTACSVNGQAGTCSGSNTTCTPTVVTQCTPDTTCCDHTGNYLAASTACTDGSGAAGTCDGASSTCTPTVVTQCVANSTCCDSSGNYAAAASVCTDGSGAAGTCDGASSTCTPTVVTQCTPDTTCCDHTGNYAAAASVCTDGSGAAGTCDGASSTCTVTQTPPTITPPAGTNPGGSTSPGGGSTVPDTSATEPIPVSGTTGGGCVLAGSLGSMASFWVMMLGMLPMLMIRRKK